MGHTDIPGLSGYPAASPMKTGVGENAYPGALGPWCYGLAGLSNLYLDWRPFFETATIGGS
jgi:hypothetical protein